MAALGEFYAISLGTKENNILLNRVAMVGRGVPRRAGMCPQCVNSQIRNFAASSNITNNYYSNQLNVI